MSWFLGGEFFFFFDSCISEYLCACLLLEGGSLPKGQVETSVSRHCVRFVGAVVAMRSLSTNAKVISHLKSVNHTSTSTLLLTNLVWSLRYS